jgi:hypothetical protein
MVPLIILEILLCRQYSVSIKVQGPTSLNFPIFSCANHSTLISLDFATPPTNAPVSFSLPVRASARKTYEEGEICSF